MGCPLDSEAMRLRKMMQAILLISICVLIVYAKSIVMGREGNPWLASRPRLCLSPPTLMSSTALDRA